MAETSEDGYKIKDNNAPAALLLSCTIFVLGGKKNITCDIL